jgi:hypothetical protein
MTRWLSRYGPTVSGANSFEKLMCSPLIEFWCTRSAPQAPDLLPSGRPTQTRPCADAHLSATTCICPYLSSDQDVA